MLRIGLTGNIGSGKTTVARLFEKLGIPVYYADKAAKRLMVENPSLREAIREKFGEETYEVAMPSSSSQDQGNSKEVWNLNRAYLAQKVFGDAVALAALNALVHPAVAQDALVWHQKQSAPYTLHEAAITFETGGDKVLDKVIVVTAPEAVRLARVIQRDRTEEADVRARMAKQWPEEKKVQHGDFLIYNYGHHLLLPQVIGVHHKLLML